MAASLVRRAEHDDLDAIDELVSEHAEVLLERYGTVNTMEIIETHFLSVVLVDSEDIVRGFAAFNDAPRPKVESDEWLLWTRQTFNAYDLSVRHATLPACTPSPRVGLIGTVRPFPPPLARSSTTRSGYHSSSPTLPRP